MKNICRRKENPAPIQRNKNEITILCITNTYLPGYKGGGPIRTIHNMVQWLGNIYDFRIITADRDLDDDEPYPGIRVNTWMQLESAEVMYVSPTNRRLFFWWKLLKQQKYDILYFNSFFSNFK